MIKLFRRKDTPELSVEAALTKLFSKETVQSLSSSVEQSDLIEAVALHLLEDPASVLSEVANYLGLSPIHKLSPPSPLALESSGFSKEQLQSRSIYLCEDRSNSFGFSFVVADPLQIELDKFLAAGHTVKLALGKAIREGWQRVESLSRIKQLTIQESELFKTLTKLAEQAQQHGATELYISDEPLCCYLFCVGNSTFNGEIDSNVVESIKARCEQEQELTNDDISGTDKFITIKKVSDSPQIFKLSWERADSCITKADTAKKWPQLVGSSRQESIVIIDDDQRFATLLKQILCAKGYDTTLYLDALEASSAIEQGDLSSNTLIICDVHLPNLDGPQFVKHLRDKRLSNPVVMLTSDNDQLLEAELALLGIDAFVKKQTDPRVLLAWLENIFAKRKVAAEPVKNNLHPAWGQNGSA